MVEVDPDDGAGRRVEPEQRRGPAPSLRLDERLLDDEPLCLEVVDERRDGRPREPGVPGDVAPARGPPLAQRVDHAQPVQLPQSLERSRRRHRGELLTRSGTTLSRVSTKIAATSPLKYDRERENRQRRASRIRLGVVGVALELGLARSSRRPAPAERDRQAVDPLALDRVDVEDDAVVRDLVARLGRAAELRRRRSRRPCGSPRPAARRRTRSLKSSIENVPSMRTVSSSTRSTVSSGRSNSSSISPTISSSRSSSVTIPSIVAVLVDHDRHVLVRAPELGQQRGEVLRLGHHRRRPHELLEVDRARCRGRASPAIRSRTWRTPTMSSIDSR